MNLLAQKQQALIARREELREFMGTLKDGEGNYKTITEDDNKKLTDFEDAISTLEKECKATKRLVDTEELNDSELKQIGQVGVRKFLGGNESDAWKSYLPKDWTNRSSAVKAFKAIPGGYSAEEQAYRFGTWVKAALWRDPVEMKRCKDIGIDLFDADGGGNIKAMSEIVNTAGGALVPTEFSATLIDLREIYGVARQIMTSEPMARDTKSIPRRTGGITAYFVGEGTAPTASDLAFDNINLVARKLAALTVFSSELQEDSAIDIGNRLAIEIAYAFAKLEDQCLLIGDGTSTYGRMTGIAPSLKNLSGTIANIAGLTVGSSGTYSGLALTDFESVVGNLPQYADGPNCAWICHRNFFYSVMLRLALAAGGVTEAEVIAGQREPRFMGYPVKISQAMPGATGLSQVSCLFGDANLAALFGDRRSETLSWSDQYKFAEDQLAVKATERFHINVHDVGNASGTASLRVPGPIVGLITAAS